MKKMLFIGVDVGTQGVRVIVCDDKGEIYSQVSKPIIQKNYLPAGWSEQDAGGWWQNLMFCLPGCEHKNLVAGFSCPNR